MENKHFTPEIKDLRVGYECEMKVYNEDRWVKLVFGNLDFSTVLDRDKDGKYSVPDCIKTPYLTKEQIESEGWKHIGGQLISVGRQNFEKIVGIRGFCELQYTPLNQKLKIEQRNHVRDGSGDYTLLTIYDGYCPSINEFRQIIKLLNI